MFVPNYIKSAGEEMNWDVGLKIITVLKFLPYAFVLSFK